MQADVEFQGFQMTLSLVKTAARAAPVVTAAEHPVPPVFLDRWSPRAFTGEPIPDTSLQCVFEAARWARPVCGLEPWRFVYAKRDTAAWPKFLGFLSPTDRSWAENASALIVVLSKSPPSRRRRPGDPAYNPSFEAGAAWASSRLPGLPHRMVDLRHRTLRQRGGAPRTERARRPFDRSGRCDRQTQPRIRVRALRGAASGEPRTGAGVRVGVPGLSLGLLAGGARPSAALGKAR